MEHVLGTFWFLCLVSGGSFVAGVIMADKIKALMFGK